MGSLLTSHTRHALTIMRLAHVRDHMNGARGAPNAASAATPGIHSAPKSEFALALSAVLNDLVASSSLHGDGQHPQRPQPSTPNDGGAHVVQPRRRGRAGTVRARA